MGQQEIIAFLKNDKDTYFSSREIKDGVKLGNSSASASLKRLRKFKVVNFRMRVFSRVYEYKYKD